MPWFWNAFGNAFPPYSLSSSRLSISNNMDVLRDKLFTAINGKPGGPNDQGKMANLKVVKCNFKYFHILSHLINEN